MTTNDQPHTAGPLLALITSELAKAGIPTARLDTLILMEDVLDKDRAYILTHPELQISKAQRTTLENLVKQRREHVPLAYLRAKVMFYGRTFYVNRDTLIPRPESENIISLLKMLFDGESNTVTIADIGTGSGCLGLTAALEIRDCRADLYDIDSDALAIAKKNAEQFDVTARYFKEDLLSQAFTRRYDAVLANLPYVPDNYSINRDATFEPRLALFAGPDGLEKYRTFWQQLARFEIQPKYILTESLPELQHVKLTALASNAGYILEEVRDFIQLFTLSNY